MAKFSDTPKFRDSKPNYVVDWQKVMDGTPNYGPAEGRLPAPIKVGLKDEHGNIREPAPDDRYPRGLWEKRTDIQGTDWWVHIEIHRRARRKAYHKELTGGV